MIPLNYWMNLVNAILSDIGSGSVYNTMRYNRLLALCWMVDHGMVQRAALAPRQSQLLSLNLDFCVSNPPSRANASCHNRMQAFWLLTKYPKSLGGAPIGELVARSAFDSLIDLVVVGFTETTIHRCAQYYLRRSKEYAGIAFDARLLTLVLGYVGVAKELSNEFGDQLFVGDHADCQKINTLLTHTTHYSQEQIELLRQWYPKGPVRILLNLY
jgi:hypothetical protein